MENISSLFLVTTTPKPPGDIAMDNLYPALIECFAIILCGYVAGRMSIISQTDAKGLNTFVGSFSLPALIFLSLAELNLSSVNWMFLLSIFVAKTVVFISVMGVTLLVSRPINPGRAGLFAIFCTQSNDFAIGYPIVVALYQKTHPDYASYLYLMAPISLVILNPLAFILMEISKQGSNALTRPGNSDGSSSVELARRSSKLHVAAAVAKSIILNPIVLMTALGMVGNLVFNHRLPVALSGVLKVLGSSFSATALFLLGLRMVGKVHTLQGAALVVPGILIAVKLLALPLVIREVVSLFHPGNSSDTNDLSTYGFLYGVFPSAPGVFVFATQYSLDVDLIASSMVACTFISAPLMFVSAKMITINKMKPSDYLQELDSFALDISIASIFACIWILVIFICGKKYKRIPHKVTLCLVISQLISCIGIVLWSLLDRSTGLTLYLQFAVYAIGVYSSRLWTAFLAITLLFLQCRSLCFVLKLQPFFIVLGWGGPLALVTVLMLSIEPYSMTIEKRNPNFQYGEVQAAIAVFILVLCFIVTIGCLVLHQRYRRRYARYLLLVQDVSTREVLSDTETDDGSPKEVHTTSIVNGCGPPQGSSTPVRRPATQKQVVDIEEIVSDRGRSFRSLNEEVGASNPGDICPARFGCHSAQRDQCQGLVKRYHIQEELEEEQDSEEDRQTLRHLVLLILLACSMFVGIALSIWTLVMEEMSGIYVELAFLDASLNFGQALMVFAVFGLDPKCVIQPLVKWWRYLWYGAAEVKLPPWDELGFETKHVCDQFATHHLEKCRCEIASCRRWRLKLYRETFLGSKLVDWLMEVGLARDRIQATQYACHLLEGRVIRHVENLHHFHDRAMLYTFMASQEAH